MTTPTHITVLLNELVESLALHEGDIAVDCTAGRGGHTALMLEAVGATGKVIALDRDPEAIAFMESRFAAPLKNGQLIIRKAPFSDVQSVVEDLGFAGKLAGVAADIGVSSPQLDVASRGFSFRNDGPLDMRMDSSSGQTAADLVNELSESELIKIFREYGEEPKAKFAAQAIVKERAKSPILTTYQLADIIDKAIFYREKSRKHPATKVFQALRIAVNDELGELERLIDTGFNLLKPRGRLSIISFHSLEDRIVKRKFEDLTGKKTKIPRDLPLTEEAWQKMKGAKAHVIKPFPIEPSEEEISANPRSRSAKLRVLEKID